eukprot:GHVU01030932.1.p1 GENE.GHVU01030932.1~~GHVU01030932.1.p1  ORF type:complete len:155 (+),score=16.57 GHVU01030932.1:203-667(+)
MATESMLKDIGEVHARLLDHRPILRGEQHFMVQRFEEQDTYALRLQQSLEQLRETGEHQIPAVKNSMDDRVTQVLGRLASAQGKCDSVLARQEHPDPPMEAWLVEQREERAKKWSSFLDGMSDRSMKLNQNFDTSIQEVTQYYRDLELKLNLAN